jgi:hypothetical protein
MIRHISLWLVGWTLCVASVAADEDIYDGPTASVEQLSGVVRGPRCRGLRWGRTPGPTAGASADG